MTSKTRFSWPHAGLSAVLALLATGAAAEEDIPGVDSFYRDVSVSDGAVLRTIVTLPGGDSTPRHPLLFAQWVSCGSVEYRAGSNSRELLAALARESGLALVRVDRSAVSGGPACEDLDFDTEFDHYLDAFTELLDAEQVDASRIYVYGSSLGATTAPLIAAELQRRGHDVAGIIVQGGGAVTYYERMLDFDRIYLERRPDAVNRLRPGTAHYVERERIGHSDNRYPTIEDAYAFENGTPAWEGAADIMLTWLADLRGGE